MRKPNFFIIGAPKCGTTSMATWLSTHPAIYMPAVKEPHYFNSDEKRYINSLSGYEKLFADAQTCHTAIGEASVWYLYSQVAVQNILAYQPDARFVVMLRNPSEMAPSLHEEMVVGGLEAVLDFEAAWDLKEERAKGNRGPRFGDARRLAYGEACKLGVQLQNLFARVPRYRVLTVVLDDVRRSARSEYRRVLEFLELADDGRADFPVLNSAKRRVWPIIPKVANAVVAAKRQLGIEGGLGIFRRLERGNEVSHMRKSLSDSTQARLRDYFADDVGLLESLLERDLSIWRGN